MSYSFGSWESKYDAWKTSPPEDEPSKLICEDCGNYIYPDEHFYRLDDCVYCEECAKDWLEAHREVATDGECNGDV